MSRGQESHRPQQSLGKGGPQESPCWELYTLFMVLPQLARKKASHSPISEDEAAVT